MATLPSFSEYWGHLMNDGGICHRPGCGTHWHYAFLCKRHWLEAVAAAEVA